MAIDRHNDILTALKTLLLTMDQGDGYWYTPNAVVTADGAFMNDLQNNAVDYLILISSGDESIAEEVGEVIEHTWEIFLACSKKYQTMSDPVKRDRGGQQSKLSVQNRMLLDVEKAIMSDVQLGGLVDNAIWPRAEVSRNFSLPEGRATIVIRLEIQFSILKDEL